MIAITASGSRYALAPNKTPNVNAVKILLQRTIGRNKSMPGLAAD